MAVALLGSAFAQQESPSVAPTPPPKFLGVPTSYLGDQETEAEIDNLMQGAQSTIQGHITRNLQVQPPSNVNLEPLWWEAEVTKPIGKGPGRRITLEEIYLRALKNSSQIKVFSDVPLIRATSIQEASGEFDTRSFVESYYNSTNDPVGDLLDTGQPNGRFIQQEFSAESGIAKKLFTGAEVKLSERVGTLRNNSDFLTPDPQGSALLKLSIRQPILRGAGIAYNNAIIDIARLDTASAYAEQIRQAESHLMEICRAYWALYLARIDLIQRLRYYQQADGVAGMLNARTSIDAVNSQIARANSAVAFRRSELVRAERGVANAQDRLRALINDPRLGEAGAAELIPIDKPFKQATPVNYKGIAQRAISQRPEVIQNLHSIRSAAIRQKKARNEILPDLALIMEGYLAGLAGDNRVGEAWTNQFDEGAPGFRVGFSFEFPWENNAAEAVLSRRQIELRQQFNQLSTTIDTVLLEAKVSAREVETSWRDYLAKVEAVNAARVDLGQMEARRELEATAPASSEPTARGTASFYLDEWLDSQSRLQVAEHQAAEAATVYQVSLTNLDRAQGNLLAVENISVVRTTDQKGIPLLELQKNAPRAQPVSGKSVRPAANPTPFKRR